MPLKLPILTINSYNPLPLWSSNSIPKSSASALKALVSTRGAGVMATRAEVIPSLLLVNVALILFYFTSGGSVRLVQAQMKTWCVAKPSSEAASLQANLDYACSQVDCSILHNGCSCFHPDNLMSHASVAMNLYYQAQGRYAWNCHFKDSALIVATDPSFGSCTYAYA